MVPTTGGREHGSAPAVATNDGPPRIRYQSARSFSVISAHVLGASRIHVAWSSPDIRFHRDGRAYAIELASRGASLGTPHAPRCASADITFHAVSLTAGGRTHCPSAGCAV